jgi:OMF family outer membrane factor
MKSHHLLALLIGASVLHADPIDLPTTLRLAGANALDVQIAQQKVEEARGKEEQRVLAFIPTLTVGVGYKNHQGAVQEVGGNVIDVSKQSYNLGGTAAMDLNLGEAWYQRLAARQQSAVAKKNVEAQRLSTLAKAAAAYFEVVRAQGVVSVAEEAVRISLGYGKQVSSAVQAGVAFKGDALRVEVQTRRNQLDLEKAKGARQQASVQLAALLRLDPSVTLQAAEGEPAALKLVNAGTNVKSLTEKALAQRPELARQLAQLAVARHERDAAVKGPWVPTFTAQVFGGGLDGGPGGSTRGLGDSEDYFVGLSWKIGAGGLFDKGRTRAAAAKLKQAELEDAQTKEAIVAEVVAAQEQAKVLAKEVEAAREGLKAAEENNKLTHERQEFAVGIVLETVLAEQELTRARTDYLNAVTANNAAQYLLLKAVGSLGGK